MMRLVRAVVSGMTVCLATSLAGVACAAPCTPADGHELVYIGTHDTTKLPPDFRPPGLPADRKFTPDTRPGGQGIYSACLNTLDGGLTTAGLAAQVARPTWLVVNPRLPILYSVSEIGNDGHSDASVFGFAIDPQTGTLRLLGHVSSGGAGATHMAIDPSADALFIANFGNGHVAALPLDAGGMLAPPSSVLSDYGSGPKSRQQGPHAHAVAVDPSGRFVLAADLGADRIFVYRYDPAGKTLSPADPPFTAVSPGSGPRHLAFLPSGKFVYMNTELGAEIFVFRWNAGNGHLQLVQTQSPLSPSYTGDRSTAELAVSRDGRFVYVSNRGEDTIVVFSADQATGRLTEVQRVAAGKTPWSFTIDPAGRWMIVANEGSSALNVMKVDSVTGMLSATGKPLPVPKPVSVAFYPQ